MQRTFAERGASFPRAPAPAFDSAILTIAAILLVAFYAAILIGAWRQGGTLFGPRDRMNHDFSVFWVAGRLTAAGRTAAVYDWEALRAAMRSLLGTPSVDATKPFIYPPMFLLLLAPLALLPYAAAAAVWLAGTLAAYLLAVRAILPGRTALGAALAAPSVLFNFVSGQNGLLTAGLLGAALALLDARPLIAGMLIGMMAYKPQFGVLLPLFLAVTGRWRVFAGAAVTMLVMVVLAAFLLGEAAFAAFLTTAADFGTGFSGHAQLQWDRLASTFGLLRATGAGPATAWAAHLSLSAAAIAASLWLATTGRPDALKAAAIPAASMAIAPYSELTDLAILTIAIAYLARDGVDRGSAWPQWVMLALAYALPLIFLLLPALYRPAGLRHVAASLGPSMCALLALIIGWRALPSRAGRRP